MESDENVTSPPGAPHVDPDPLPTPPGIPDAVPLWRFYWFSIGTLGIHLPIWTHRIAKCSWGGRPRSSTPVWWALGCFAPPAAVALLIDFRKRARTSLVEAGGSESRFTGWPALIYVAILLIGGYSPLGSFPPTMLLLLPVPFLMVQRAINHVHRRTAETTPLPVRAAHPVEWVGVSFGTVALAMLMWYLSPSLLSVLSPRHGAGTVIDGISGQFSITLPSDSWRVVRPGTLGDAESDLELLGPGVESWLVGYTHDRALANLDGTIDARRGTLATLGKLRSLEESRRFLDRDSLVPVSVAHYEVHGFGQGNMKFVVLTAETEQSIIELIGHSVEPDSYMGELTEMTRTFRTIDQDEVP